MFHEGPRHLNNISDNIHVSIFDNKLMNVDMQGTLEFRG